MKSSVMIQWSEEDGCFVVFLPEIQDRVMQPVTHGDTYEDALKNALEVLELLEEERTVEKSEVTEQLIQTA